MSDKIRGALFNVLGDISGLTVLDAFAGSGALSFEAISRGAKQAVAIESDKNAQQAISQNVNMLHLNKHVKLIRAAAGAWMTTADDQFDLVLLDPPYDNVQPNLLSLLLKRTKVGGVAALSLPPDLDFEASNDFDHLQAKEYGDSKLVFYRRIS
jgi:16S rRNA (guanine966-N2)-methyltransferase